MVERAVPAGAFAGGTRLMVQFGAQAAERTDEKINGAPKRQ